MSVIERVGNWVDSRRALSDNPIGWLSPQKHYKKFEEKASVLDEEVLREELKRYKHNTRNKFLITGLALGAGVGTLVAVGPVVGPVVTALSLGPLGLGACLLGVNRGIIRDGEKEILQEAINKTSQSDEVIIYQAG